MDKEIFIQNFKLLLVQLNDLTNQFCHNDLSTNYKFILEPSERTKSKHLTNNENNYLKTWNKLKDKQISFDQVVSLFYKEGKTPKWADCNIHYSNSNLTVVKIFFSRQFKDEKEIYYLERGTGPFKAVVAMPPDHLKTMHGDKFDLNWKKNFDNNKPNNIFTKLKDFLN
jgi:hypothetical protein